jgi:molybdopterin converting factor small subunit
VIHLAGIVSFDSAQQQMQATVQFHSYFKELTACSSAIEMFADGTTLGALHEQLMTRFPKLTAMKKSTLIAVGVDYQTRDYVLKDGDEVSLFPPVQGG